MIRGLYRTCDILLGEAVRVHWSAGDAAPILSAQVYREMGGVPPLEDLPSREEYERWTYRFLPDMLETGY